MPTKTIYVADADLPIFERAQALAGGNLSATIAQVLRRFVETHAVCDPACDPACGKLTEQAVRLGDHGTYVARRFRGRALARRQLRDRERTAVTLQTVYETAKGHYALHTATRADWATRSMLWSKRGRARGVRASQGVSDDPQGSGGFDWAAIDDESDSFRLDVYDTLDELRAHIPPELYNAVDDALRGPEADFLDI